MDVPVGEHRVGGAGGGDADELAEEDLAIAGHAVARAGQDAGEDVPATGGQAVEGERAIGVADWGRLRLGAK